jgi:isoleucyl-tRNA synthetase
VALTASERALTDDLATLRSAALKQIEALRVAGAIGGSLEAEVTIAADPGAFSALDPMADELRFFFITSAVHLRAGAGDAVLELAHGKASVSVATTTAPKCVRCWHHRSDVGTTPQHPELCDRCVSNVDGPGEVRRWF